MKLGVKNAYFEPHGRRGWSVRFRDASTGERRRVMLRSEHEGVAFAEAMTKAIDFSRGIYDPFAASESEGKATIRSAVQAFLEHNPSLAKGTIRERRILLSQLARSFPVGARISDVGRDDLTVFLFGRGHAPSTIHGYRAKLATFFGWCLSEGLVTGDPTLRLPKAPTVENAPRYLTRAQVALLVSTCEKRAADTKDPRLAYGFERLRVAILLGVSTGLRLSEMCHLKWEHVAERADDPHVRVANTSEHTTKSKKERFIPIFPATLGALDLSRDLLSGSAYVLPAQSGGRSYQRVLSKSFTRMRVQCGLPEGITFHSLRHTFASWLVMGGEDLLRVQYLMGHASYKTTQRYAHLAPDSLSKVGASVFS